MTVELDVFSGRPNPEWTLTEAEEKRVRELLRDLRTLADRTEPGLGYRGFVVKEKTRRVFVSTGALRIESDTSIETYQDAHGLESYLKELARGRGYGELVGPGDK